MLYGYPVDQLGASVIKADSLIIDFRFKFFDTDVMLSQVEPNDYVEPLLCFRFGDKGLD
jgi:hypothetical protein